MATSPVIEVERLNVTYGDFTRVSQLSGGEKRRLDFATAVYGGPELVILDEPTTGLDIQSRDALWTAVDRLRDDGSTIVLTTHYLEEAQQRADRIALMHQAHCASRARSPISRRPCRR